ncbi:bifunctional 3-(3-hydroxy-phenyl)propionate/3-hydroxycinnamic acid hydroxylase [Breoghania sp. L-A4]|uniref:bifunctional 3-(3-hydroxy-phenyl)propionate/3-hydroxycinnamic acid hydroxylase n=1 Tax=Breoghania sp. L-A4 TaxID=2304600 RepID=UPI001967DB2D|nr:bifunctional 3-(3-hydroxy-phenyl)propionate/3-hydroxycinnamic acid hydroxylase [Breoghania sp. L-A4]
MTAYVREVPVVIVGGGPTGLTAANLLAAYGVEFLLLEREAAPLNLPRAIVLDDEGARTLQVFGLDKTYVAQTLEGVGSRYYSDAGVCFAETGAGPRTYGFSKRQYIYQPEMEAALRSRLEEQAPGALRFSSEVTAIACANGKAHVTVRDAQGAVHEIVADWVLACDGGKSPIRELLGIEMHGNTYEQDWIVLDTLDDPDTSAFSKFFCSNERPAVSVPAPNGGRRYEFMLLPGETREQVLDSGFLARLLQPFRVHDEKKIVRKTVYTFHARIAERFRDDRIVLLGDAAHLTPPFAGQGMNAGLRDAHNVTWKIAATLKGGADASILDSFETERRKPIWDMIQLAVTMGNVVMPMDEDALRFRDHLLRALEPFPAVKDYLVQMRFKPKPRHPGGLYLDLDAPKFEASLVGEMIPQPDIRTNGAPGPLDSALGTGFALIAQDETGAEALAALEDTDLLGLPLEKLCLGAGEGRGIRSGRRSMTAFQAAPC